MKQPYWKPQHEVFVRSMLQHEDLTKAYRTAYPKASASSARTAAFRLYRLPYIRQRIEPVLNRRSSEAMQRARQSAAERHARQQAAAVQMQEYLRRIIHKEAKKRQVFKVKGREITVELDFSVSIRLRAALLNFKLAEGNYDNLDALERQFARLRQQVEGPAKPAVHPDSYRKCVANDFRQQPVTILQPGPMSVSLSAGYKYQENHPKTGNKYTGGNIFRRRNGGPAGGFPSVRIFRRAPGTLKTLFNILAVQNQQNEEYPNPTCSLHSADKYS